MKNKELLIIFASQIISLTVAALQSSIDLSLEQVCIAIVPEHSSVASERDEASEVERMVRSVVVPIFRLEIRKDKITGRQNVMIREFWVRNRGNEYFEMVKLDVREAKNVLRDSSSAHDFLVPNVKFPKDGDRDFTRSVSLTDEWENPKVPKDISTGNVASALAKAFERGKLDDRLGCLKNGSALLVIRLHAPKDKRIYIKDFDEAHFFWKTAATCHPKELANHSIVATTGSGRTVLVDNVVVKVLSWLTAKIYRGFTSSDEETKNRMKKWFRHCQDLAPLGKYGMVWIYTSEITLPPIKVIGTVKGSLFPKSFSLDSLRSIQDSEDESDSSEFLVDDDIYEYI